MMFFVHSMFSLELIALVSGVALLILIKNQQKLKAAWLQFVAWFVIILSALSILCTAYQAISAWSKGYFNIMNKSMMMMHNEMMKKTDEMKGTEQRQHTHQRY
jgi:hypothetical protein